MPLWITVITVLVWILVPATPLSVYHDCLPERKWSRRWEGSHVEMTVWLTEESVMTDPEQSLLTFTMEPIGSSRPYDYDVVRMSRHQVEIIRFRNGNPNKSELSLPQPLPVGWAAFNLSSTSLTELWLLPHTKLVSLSADMTIAKLNIDGSNITVGCHHNVFGWEVVEGGAVTVPLPHRDRHYLSTYSNTVSQPRLTLGNTTLQLGWDGSTLVDVTHYDIKYQRTLPAATEHHLFISCNSSYVEAVICNIEAGKKILKTVDLGELPTSVTIQEKSEEQFYVFYHRVNDNVTDDSKSSSAAEDDGNNKTAIIILSLLLAVAVVVVAVLVVFTRRYFTQKKTDQTISLENADSAGQQLLPHKFQEQHELQSVNILLRNAIITGKADQVKTLLRQTDNRDDAYVEAHIQAKKDIIQIISVKENEGIEIPDNNLISWVLNVLQQRLNDVFRAAEMGMYHKGGVKTLLASYGLPGTIRDKRGCSLLHYMAETLDEDGSPAWSYDDIKDYLDSEEYYINAVDYKGQTVLHTLAGHQQINKKVNWNDKDQLLEDVWCKMAEMFIGKGCNPTLRNHSGKIPVDIAMDKGETKFSGILKKSSQYFKFDFEKNTERHTELVIAAGEGDTKTMEQLLKTGVPLLPMAARADPLLHAIRHNQRDAVFLLLSAGAPLCNQSIEDVTPLEGAHNTLGLPAVFPALIRLAYSEKIQMEIQTLKSPQISGTEEEEELFQVMESYKKCFKDSGKFSEFVQENNNYDEGSKKARGLLRTAASHGLSLTCVLLGLEDVCIHPLQNEENPFKLAFTGFHFDTQITLCRDMNMTPFTFPLPHSSNLPADLLQEYWVNERKVLKDICSGKHYRTKLNKDETNILRKYIEQLSKVKPNEDLKSQDITLERPDDFFLYLLAKHDLVYILFILHEKIFEDMDINRVVESFSECTMLHVASMYGRLNMIEYLLYRKPELDKVTLGKYSAAHLAAIGGHKECYQYILARMKGDQKEMKCNIQLTAADLMRKYEEFCSNCHLPLMTREEALHVKNETEDGKRAHELLYIKGNNLKITKPDDLFDVAVNNMCEEKKVIEISDKIKIETDKLVESIEDKKFKGKTVLTGPLVEGNEIFHINYVDFMYEVSPEQDIMCKSSGSHGEVSITSHDSLLKGSRFREELSKHLKKAIKNYVSKSSDKSDISVAPPFLLHTHKGVYIRWVWNHQYFCLLTSYIVPTLEAELLINKEENRFEPVLITNIYDKWILRNCPEETRYFKDLSKDDRKVWLACRLLRKITLQLWFAPRFSTKRYTLSWNTWSVGIEGLEERILKQLFQEEKNRSTEWDKKSLFDRVMSVYSRAANKESGKWVPRKDEDFHGNASSVCGILEYLESLKKNDNF